jgi:replicative DNA helicase
MTDAWGTDLPVNVEAEMILCGAVLLRNDLWEQVSEIVQADHFAELAHALVWHAYAEMFRHGRAVTPVTLKSHLADLDMLDEAGGAAYLARLAAAVTIPSTAPDMAREVRDTWLRREIIGWARQLEARARRGDLDDDPARMIDDTDQQLVDLRSAWAVDDRPTDMAHHAAAAKEEILGAYANGGPVRGLATGFRWIDQKISLGPGDLTIIAARPAMGKTSLALNVAEHLSAGLGLTGFIASLEMSGKDLVTRLIATRLRIPGDRLARGELSEAEAQAVWQAEQAIAGWPLHVDDRSSLTPTAVRAQARRIQRRHGLGYIVIDYLQIMAPPETRDRRYQSNNDVVTAISMAAKQMARDLGVPVILLSQLSRDVEKRADKRPLLSDLRDGGAIEQDADIVMFVYRPEYYLERDQPERSAFKDEDAFLVAEAKWTADLARERGRAEIIIAKNRKGPTGIAHMWFDRALTRFSDFAPEAAAAAPAEEMLF